MRQNILRIYEFETTANAPYHILLQQLASAADIIKSVFFEKYTAKIANFVFLLDIFSAKW